MKVGIRKPSIKKSISAKTNGRITRNFKKTINPAYGKKGIGIITDPKKAMYNKIYNKSTVSISNLGKVNKSSSIKVNNSMAHEQDKIILNTNYSNISGIENRIRALKCKRNWLNVIGYFFLVPGIVSFVSILEDVPREPALIITGLSITVPFMFMIYKARNFSKQIKNLKEELDLHKESIKNKQEKEIVDELKIALEMDEPIDIIYEISDKEELLERIIKSHASMVDIVGEMIKSFKKYNFSCFEIEKGQLITDLRDIRKSCDALKTHIEDDALDRIYLENIICIVDSFNHVITILTHEVSIAELDYAYGQDIDMTNIMNSISNIIDLSKQIQEELPNLIEELCE